jgi:hypothetical protein
MFGGVIDYMISIILTFNHAGSYYGKPYDSAGGIPPSYSIVAFLVLGYIVLRLWWELRKEKRK